MIDAASTSTQGQLNVLANLEGNIGVGMRLEQGLLGQEGASSDAQAGADYLDIISSFGMGPEEIEELLDGLPATENMGGRMIQPIDTRFSFDRTTAQALESTRDELQGTEWQAIQNDAQLMEVDIESGIGGLVQSVVGTIAQALEPMGGELQGIECQVTRDNAQLMPVNVENGIGGLVKPVAGAASSAEWLPCNTSHETIADALPTSHAKLVGEAFEKNKNEIRSWLMNDEVSLMGIYGMGGVGKTSLMKYIHEILERSDTFDHVCWITVSQEFSISKLHNSIAKCIGLDLSNEDDELHKAAKLSKQLKKKHRWILILDDLWNCFELDRVGIPIQMKRCKLILTTRSLKICERMVCQKMIKVEPLLWEEAWTLFMEKVGHDTILSSKMERIAESITRECDGLPLGIITMAGSMRAVVDICEWRNAVDELKESKIRKDDMEPDVFKILRFSYNHLNDSALQQCFLYCALWPEDDEINRALLIGYLIDEGIIEEMKSRRAEFDKGHTMLNKLEKVSLLESCQDHRAVKMHDLLRDMAIQIQQEKSQVLVKARQQLKEFPDLEKWKESLVRVSVVENEIKKIRRSHSVGCPRLSTLFLQFNVELRFIADSFFKQLHSLKVLDLSFTSIEILPNSISDLVTLTSFSLRCCKKLRQVPSMRKLKRLKSLDLAATILENMPQGMKVSNLRYLSLGGCRQNPEFPIGILPKLSHLENFIQRIPYDSDVLWICKVGEDRYPATWVKGKEVARLRKLETVECHFEHLCDMEAYLKTRDETQSLGEYCFLVGRWDLLDYHRNKRLFRCTGKTVGLANLSISRDNGDLQVMFPSDMKELRIYRCDGGTSLSDFSSSIDYAIELEVVDMRDCNSMETLLSSRLLKQLSSQSIFSGLKEFTCRSCRSMKKLFPLILLPSLLNLEYIRVGHCEKMEEIIATRDGDEDELSSSCNSIIEFRLPKLRILELRSLPQLKSICSAKLRCDSIEEIGIYNCPKLKRMPISLPLPQNQQLCPPPISLKKIKIHPKEWWQSVEWDHPNAKDVLLPFVYY